ncbi:carbonic anhydrase 5B, mitochondrial isoform X1 [Salmo trutta]|uniref:Carbonic anhydrase n=1 Tax=Salmo trutta TaxID=8032 RepID=A0A673YA74_SALTR|nr:carbonic anhydrase 5B, mitochondrial-like isoform X1 [Salmo trutta]XP_029613806.1 carbonic anhydrase 5B, mitochondrial-like isoform X1 [Salmo trutta]
MVALRSVLTPLARHIHRHLIKQTKGQRLIPVRRCNLTACSSKYVLSALHPMWQGPLVAPGGNRQSPIDIRVRKSVFDPHLKPLTPDYDPGTCSQIWNNGYSFLVEYDDTTDKSILKGGPLEDNFRLCQFHFHWGESNAWGSEHTVDRRLFPAELHMVHWNSNKYSRFEEAVMEENGLAVIGVFLKIGKRHEGLQKLVDVLPAVRHKDSVVEFTRFDPASLLPANIDDYWTYAGSLTTPPLTEAVTWIIMKQHIEVSHDQLAVFRSLLFTSAEEEVQKSMVNNFRVQQPLRGRTVRSSFTPFLQQEPPAKGPHTGH